MISNRQKIILRILLESDTYLDSEYFSYRLDISTKTVQNEMKILEEYLRRTKIQLISKRGFGYAITVKDAKDKEELYQRIYEFSPLEDTVTQKAFIICYLLLQEDYVTQEMLSIHLYSPKRAIVKLVDEIKSSTKENKLNLQIKPGKGYLFEGDEYAKRLAFTRYFEILQSHRTLEYLFKTSFGFSIEDLPVQKFEMIRKIVNKYNIAISEVNLNSLRIYMALSYNRISHGHRIETVVSRLKIFNRLIAPSEEMLELIEVEQEPFEAQFLSLFISLLYEKSQLDQLYKDQFMTSYSKNSNLVTNYMDQIFEPYNNLIDSPINLNKKLALLLIMVTNQKNIGFLERDIDLVTVDDEMMIALECAILFAEYVESEQNVKFNRNDILTFAFFFNNEFSYAPTVDRRTLMIVSEKGEAIAQALARRLRKEVEQYTYAINISNTIDANELRQQNLMIVTDMERFAQGESNVIFYPNLSDYETIIPNLKFRILDKNERLLLLLDHIKQDRFFYNAPIKNIKEVINFIADEEKLNSMQRVELRKEVNDCHDRYFTSVRQQAAIIRFYDEKRTEASIMIIIPAKAFTWNGSKVKIIFVFLFPKKYPPLMLLANPLTMILANGSLMHRLVQSKSVDEFKKYILRVN